MEAGGIIAGWVALAISAVAIWLGFKTDNMVKALVNNLNKAHEKESERVDKLTNKLIELLENRR